MSADAVSWREKTEFWQALTTCAEQQPLSCVPTADDFAVGPETSSWKSSSTIRKGEPWADCSRNAKRVLIETTEDTTRPDPARRAGLIELLVIESILGKLRLRDAAATGAANVLQRSADAALGRISDTVEIARLISADLGLAFGGRRSGLLQRRAWRASAASFSSAWMLGDQWRQGGRCFAARREPD